MTTLSVVIPATDRPVTLGTVVAAAERATGVPEELIVVDSPRDLGPAAARNRGARQASGNVIVFVDADVEVHEDAFQRIRSAFDGDPGLAAIFGSYDDSPGADGIVSDFRNLLHHHVHHQGAGVATTFWAGLGAIRREVFLDLGGFDEERFPRPSVEDIELGMRLHERGHRALLDPAIQGKHLKTWTLLNMTKTDLLQRGVPWLRLILERRSQSTALNLGWRNRVGTAASLLLVVGLVRRRFWVSGGALALLVALEGRFYVLLLRRRGPLLVAAGLPLHVVHRLTSAAAVPIALAAHLSANAWGRRPSPP
ncbi:MAG TPA: glycosyltransferase family A protein [Gaiellaceae bacterium]|nr:glycosyltransferase family A protein [Gaiellaceae bacterium]